MSKNSIWDRNRILEFQWQYQKSNTNISGRGDEMQIKKGYIAYLYKKVFKLLINNGDGE